MTKTGTALILGEHPALLTAVDLAAVEAYVEHIAQVVGGMGGRGVNSVQSSGRRWLAAIREHQQEHLRLGAEVLRKDARLSAPPRTDRMLIAVANPDRSNG
jgi:hypothetical protein